MCVFVVKEKRSCTYAPGERAMIDATTRRVAGVRGPRVLTQSRIKSDQRQSTMSCFKTECGVMRSRLQWVDCTKPPPFIRPTPGAVARLRNGLPPAQTSGSARSPTKRANLGQPAQVSARPKQKTAPGCRGSAFIRNAEDASCQRPDDDESAAPEAAPPRSSNGRRRARWTHG